MSVLQNGFDGSLFLLVSSVLGVWQLLLFVVGIVWILCVVVEVSVLVCCVCDWIDG